MKKSLVAVSVIAVLGAAWTGGSWYTGKMLEQRMDDIVANANSQLHSAFPKAGLKVVYQNYQRGFFNSKATILLQPDTAVAGDKILKPGEEIAFTETIGHGPFPLAQLKKFNLIPSMASVHTELQNTPLVKPLFDITKGKSLFNADTRVSYNGGSASSMNLIPVQYQKDANKLDFSGAKIELDIDREMTAMNVSGSSDNMAITSINPAGLSQTISLIDFNFDSDTKQGKFKVSIGDQNVNVKKVTVVVDDKETVSLDGFKLTSNFSEDGNNIKGQQDYALDTLKIQGADFGSGKLTVKIDKLDGAALQQFSDNYNQQSRQLLAQAESLTPEDYQQQASQLLISNLPILLKGNPSISLSPLSWKNSKGESSFNLQLDLNDVQTDSSAESLDQLIAQRVKKLDAKLVIPMAMATELTTQAAQLQGYSSAEATKLATEQVQGVAAMGKMFKLTTLENDAISTSLHLVDNQIDLNGQKMSLQQFIGLFGLFGGSQ